MNKIYKLIWSKVKNMWVAVAEIAKSHTKAPRSGIVSRTVVAGVLSCLMSCGAVMPVYAIEYIGNDDDAYRKVYNNDSNYGTIYYSHSLLPSDFKQQLIEAQGNNNSFHSDSKVYFLVRTDADNNLFCYVNANMGDGSSHPSTFFKLSLDEVPSFVLDDLNKYRDFASYGAIKQFNDSSITLGLGSKATSDKSIAVGNNNKVSGSSSIAVGTGHIVTGNNSGTFGDPNVVNGDNSYVVGNNSSVASNVENAFVFGNNTNITNGTNNDGTPYSTWNSTADGVIAMGNGVVVRPRSSYDGRGLTQSADGVNSVSHVVAIGDDVLVREAQTVGIGYDAEVTGYKAVAIGAGATVNHEKSTVIGSGSKTTGSLSTAVGSDAIAYGYRSVAIGAGAQALVEGASSYDSDNGRTRAVAIGAGSKAMANLSVAIGDNAVAEQGKAWVVSVGANSYSGQLGSFASGYGAKAFGKNGVAMGRQATAGKPADGSLRVDPSSAVQSKNDTEARNAVAIGYLSLANEDNAIALGYKTEATGVNAIALGSGVAGNDKDFTNSITRASGQNSMAFGFNARASNQNSIAIGSDSQVTGEKSIAIGLGHRVLGNNSGTFGDPNIVNGDNSYVVGNNSTVAENTSNVFVLGNNVNTTGSNTVVLGGSTDSANKLAVTGSNSVVLGVGSDGSQSNVVSVGNSTSKRKIVNVADGASATDAATVGQTVEIVGSGSIVVQELDTPNAIGQKKVQVSLNSNLDGVVQYDAGTNKGQVTLQGPVGTGTKLTGLADGTVAAASSDAVTGKQLYEQEQRIDTLRSNITSLNTTVATNSTNISTLQTNYTNLNSTVNTVKTQLEAGFDVMAGSTKVKTVTPTSRDLKFVAGDDVSITNDNGSVKIASTIDKNGSVVADNTGLVTGGTVYTAINTEKTAREAADTTLQGNIDTEATARTDADTALSDRIGTLSADGNYILQENNVSQNLGVLDTQLKTNTDGLTAEVTARTNADTALSGRIGVVAADGTYIKSSETKNIAENLSLLDTGLAKEVTDRTAAVTAEKTAREAADTALSDRIGTLSADGSYVRQANNVNQNLSALDTAVNNLSDGKADISLSNIDNAGKTVVRNLAKESVKVVDGTYTTVTEGTDGDAKTYAVNVTADGVVENNNTGLVTGGTVYTAVNAEKTARESADTVLQGNIDTEATARGNEDTRLAGLITSEESARTAADIALSERIGTLSADGKYILKSNDVSQNLSVLDTQVKANADSLAAEVTARENADTALSERITTNANNIATNTTDITNLKDLSNITDAGKTVIKDLAKGSVNVVGSGLASVTKTNVEGVDTYTVGVVADGEVVDGNTKLVNGGTVHTAIQNAIGDLNTDIQTSLNGKANIALDNVTDVGHAVIKSDAKAALNVVGGNYATVAKTDVNGVDTYTVNVATDGTVVDGNTKLVTGATVYNAIQDAKTEFDTKIADRTAYFSVNSTETPNRDGKGATGVDAMAIGDGASASGNSSAALGDYADAKGLRSIALGNSAGAEKDYGIAIGGLAKAKADGGIALGTSANVTGANAMALGNSAKAEGATSYAIGQGANAKGESSVALGTATESAVTGVAVGHSAKATGESGVAIGTSTTAGKTAIALGHGANASVEASTAIGINSSATANHAVALGTGSVANEANTVSVGNAETKRRIVNVADATGDNDAVNLKQVKAVKTALEEADTAILDKIGTLASDGNYIGKDNTVSENLSVLDTQVKSNTDTLSVHTTDIANLKDLSNITDAGKEVIRTYVKGAMNITGSGKATVTKTNVEGVDTYNVEVLANGAVADGNTDIVSGGTVHSAIEAVKTELGTAIANSSAKYFGVKSAGGYESNEHGEGAIGDGSIAIGTSPMAMGENSIAIGPMSATMGKDSLAVGNGAVALDDSAIALGKSAQAPTAKSLAIGDTAIASGQNSVALGAGADTNNKSGAVAIGNGAVSDAEMAVSFGKAATETEAEVVRRLMHVGNGVADSDAATMGQLKELDERLLQQLNSLGSNAVLYDDTDRATVTFGGERGTLLTNVKSGAVTRTSMDAVNGSQLWGVKEDIKGFAADIKRNKDNISSLNNSVTAALESVSTSSLLVDTVNTTKADTSLNNLTAAGRQVINAAAANAVQEYMASQKANSNGTNSVDSGLWVANNNDAMAGRIADLSDGGSKAGNVLAKASSVSGMKLMSTDTSSDTNYVVYDDAEASQITLESPVGIGTKVTGVAEGFVSAASTDAVNGARLYATEQRLDTVESDVISHNVSIANVEDELVRMETSRVTMESDINTLKTQAETGFNVTVDGAKVKTVNPSDNVLDLSAGNGIHLENAEGSVRFSVDTEAVGNALQDKFDAKADKDSVYTRSETDALVNVKADKSYVDEGLAAKADITSVYTKAEADDMFVGKTAMDEALKNKANADASNVDVKSWSDKLGVGEVAEGNEGLVKGGAVYDAINRSAVVIADNESGVLRVGGSHNYDSYDVVDVSKSDGSGRVITGVVTDPSNASSAANVGYVNEIGQNIINGMNNGLRRVDDKINKVGAGAAALASLAPLPFDEDQKWNISAAIGTYKGEQAGALGVFYKPADNVMLNVRAAIGNGENMGGAGVTLGLNKGAAKGLSKVAMAKAMNAQAAEIANQKQVIVDQQAQLESQKVEIAELRNMMQQVLKQTGKSKD